MSAPEVTSDMTALPVSASGRGGIIVGVGEGVPGALSGSGIEGAQAASRETVNWWPSFRSPDQTINIVKPTADARGRDSAWNDGYALNGVNIHRDSIVGNQFRLSAQPNYEALELTAGWADDFQTVVEDLFTLTAESHDCWLDVQRVNTFTGQIRLMVASHVLAGEVLCSAEWIREANRPCKTAVQILSPDRLSNPGRAPDTLTMRRGVEKDSWGKPVAYHIQAGYPTESYVGQNVWTWDRVPARTPWGRRQVLHIIEQLLPDQSRGVADMVSVLSQMRMTKNFQQITLQNAVINASYAAAIESELPGEVVAAMMGQQTFQSDRDPYTGMLGGYLDGLAKYLAGANNIRVEGAMIPHLYPGTKLTTKTLGTPGGVGTHFEASLLRHVAAGLGLSYEEFAKDYSQVSYSSARASMATTEKFMLARKKAIADRAATEVYALWLEEAWNNNQLPIPKGKTKALFYQPLVKEALTRSRWIAGSAGQIDELKETQAAVLKVNSGLSTYAVELARLGRDYREEFVQAAREQRMIESLDLALALSAKRPLGAPMPQNTEDASVTAENKTKDTEDETADDGGKPPP